MAAQTEPEIVLYDLACTKNICFSPVVWRIRLMLNYKQITYKTIFLEFPDIGPTLKNLGMVPYEPTPGSEVRYTVPAIHHIPTNKYIMDSVPIAQFLESNYPDPPVPLISELGREIEAKARSVGASVFGASVMPREIRILLPRSQEYFRHRVESRLGHPLEDLLDVDKEDQAWKSIEEGMRTVDELMRTNRTEGPFILGAQPSITDFFIAASLQCGRTVDEGIFQRYLKYPGFMGIYEACLPYMNKKD